MLPHANNLALIEAAATRPSTRELNSDKGRAMAWRQQLFHMTGMGWRLLMQAHLQRGPWNQ
jgi:hypothetical protein